VAEKVHEEGSMRSPLTLSVLVLTAATAACTSDLTTAGTPGSGGSGGSAGTSGAAGLGGGSADGGTFCPLPLNDCAHPNVGFLPSGVDYCTLSAGIAGACKTGGPIAGLTNGAVYTYLDFANVDVGARLAYDATGMLVAVLYFSANPPTQWSCLEGPSVFNATEATSLPLAPSSALGRLAAMCP
jgi:hypothetical protein